MKKSTSIWIGLVVAGCWLATGVLWAKPPGERPRAGGLPKCEAELTDCTVNLTETTGELMQCESALAGCQATAEQAFPATGQTICWDNSGGLIGCAGTGQDGEIKAGAKLAYTDTGMTIIDNTPSWSGRRKMTAEVSTTRTANPVMAMPFRSCLRR